MSGVYGLREQKTNNLLVRDVEEDFSPVRVPDADLRESKVPSIDYLLIRKTSARIKKNSLNPLALEIGKFQKIFN